MGFNPLDPLGVKKKAKKKLKKEFKGTFFGDLVEFEDMQLKRWGRMLKENPEQALLGGLTPVGGKFWSEVTGEDYEPFVNVWGGPTAQTYAEAERKGIDTDSIAKSHQIAEMVAGTIAGGQLSGLAGDVAGRMGSQYATRAASAMTPTVTTGALQAAAGAVEDPISLELTRPRPMGGLSVWNVPTIARGGYMMRYR